MSSVGYCLAQAYVERKRLKERMAAMKSRVGEVAEEDKAKAKFACKSSNGARAARKVHPGGDVVDKPGKLAEDPLS